MKKTCLLLAAMLALPTVVTVQPPQEVSAYEIEDDWSYVYSARAGAYSGLDRYERIEVDSDEDFEGWKAAICPADNWTLDGAVLTASLDSKLGYHEEVLYDTDEEKYKCYVEISWGELESDIPGGVYALALFDENGVARVDYKESDARTFVDKTPISFGAEIGQGEEYDGFVYAYVYENDYGNGTDFSLLGANTYPIFLAEDGETAITKYDSYTKYEEYGQVKHVYRLKVLDEPKLRLQEGEEGIYETDCLYKVNGDFYTAGRVNSKGQGILTVGDMEGVSTFISEASMKEELASALKKAQSINTTGKTEASVKALTKAAETAKTVLANKESSKKEISDALKALNAAIEVLEGENATPSAGTETSNKNKKTSPKTGEGFWDFLF